MLGDRIFKKEVQKGRNKANVISKTKGHVAWGGGAYKVLV
jgi:hypothetical protein